MSPYPIFFRRLIAVFTAAVLSTQTLFPSLAQAGLWDERRAARTPAAPLSSPVLEVPDLAAVPFSDGGSLSLNGLVLPDNLRKALPLEYGDIRVENRGSLKRVVFHIQDIHGDATAQKNISDALKSFIALMDGGVGMVGLEGAFTPIDLSRAAALPQKEALRAAADYLLEKKTIAGPVHGALTADGVVPLVGVDDPILYSRNVRAYRLAAPHKTVALAELSLERAELMKRRDAVFSPALKALDDAVQSFHEGGNLQDYAAQVDAARRAAGLPSDPELAGFLSASAAESSVDFEKAGREREALIGRLSGQLTPERVSALSSKVLELRRGAVKQGTFFRLLESHARAAGVSFRDFPALSAYVSYVEAAERIRPDALFSALEKMEARAYVTLASGPAAKAAAASLKTFRLKQRLVSFSLTPKEWDEYISAPREGADLSMFEDFYRAAHERDGAMARALLKSMADKNVRVAVLVTGGFHSPGLRSRLSGAGATVLSFTPRMGAGSLSFTEDALSAFSRAETPFEAFFSASRSALSEPALDAPKAGHVASTALGAGAALSDRPLTPEETSALGLSVLPPDAKAEKDGNFALVTAEKDGKSLAYRVETENGRVSAAGPVPPSFWKRFKSRIGRALGVVVFAAALLVPSPVRAKDVGFLHNFLTANMAQDIHDAADSSAKRIAFQIGTYPAPDQMPDALQPVDRSFKVALVNDEILVYDPAQGPVIQKRIPLYGYVTLVNSVRGASVVALHMARRGVINQDKLVILGWQTEFGDFNWLKKALVLTPSVKDNFIAYTETLPADTSEVGIQYNTVFVRNVSRNEEWYSLYPNLERRISLRKTPVAPLNVYTNVPARSPFIVARNAAGETQLLPVGDYPSFVSGSPKTAYVTADSDLILTVPRNILGFRSEDHLQIHLPEKFLISPAPQAPEPPTPASPDSSADAVAVPADSTSKPTELLPERPALPDSSVAPAAPLTPAPATLPLPVPADLTSPRDTSGRAGSAHPAVPGLLMTAVGAGALLAFNFFSQSSVDPAALGGSALALVGLLAVPFSSVDRFFGALAGRPLGLKGKGDAPVLEALRVLHPDEPPARLAGEWGQFLRAWKKIGARSPGLFRAHKVLPASHKVDAPHLEALETHARAFAFSARGKEGSLKNDALLLADADRRLPVGGMEVAGILAPYLRSLLGEEAHKHYAALKLLLLNAFHRASTDKAPYNLVLDLRRVKDARAAVEKMLPLAEALAEEDGASLAQTVSLIFPKEWSADDFKAEVQKVLSAKAGAAAPQASAWLAAWGRVSLVSQSLSAEGDLALKDALGADASLRPTRVLSDDTTGISFAGLTLVQVLDWALAPLCYLGVGDMDKALELAEKIKAYA